MSPFPTRADGRGLPALGAVLLLGCAVYAAALVDVTFTGSLGWALGVVLVVGSLAAAARLARRDLAFAVVAPPLAFAVGTAAVVPYTAASREAGFPLGTVLAFAGALGGGAPLLGTAVLAAAAVAGVRWELERRSHGEVGPLADEPQTPADPQDVPEASADHGRDEEASEVEPSAEIDLRSPEATESARSA